MALSCIALERCILDGIVRLGIFLHPALFQIKIWHGCLSDPRTGLYVETWIV